jgi:hypothetical protein
MLCVVGGKVMGCCEWLRAKVLCPVTDLSKECNQSSYTKCNKSPFTSCVIDLCVM